MSVNKRPRVVLVNRCFVRRDDGKLLIVKRSPEDRNHPEKWEVPGGKVDVGQDLIQAQEREVLEETGLLARPTHRMVFVETFVIGTGQYKGMPYIAHFHITQVVGGNLALSDEHTNHAWVNYDEMMRYDLTPEVRKAAIEVRQHLI